MSRFELGKDLWGEGLSFVGKDCVRYIRIAGDEY